MKKLQSRIVPMMAKSRKVWPETPSVLRLKLNLLIDQLELLPGELLQSCQNSSFMVQIKWKGSRKIAGFLMKRSVRNCSSKQQIHACGVVCWNEAFDHDCKLRKADDTQSYKSWIINLEIQEFDCSNSGNTTRILGTAAMDIVEFLNLENERSIRIPINCGIRDHAILTIKLHFIELMKRGSTQSTLTRALSLGPLSSTRYATNYQGKVSDCQLDSSASNKGADFQKPNDKIKRSHSLLRLLSLRPKLSFKNFTQDEEKSKLSDMPNNNHTEEIGSWEEKRVVSRDGKLELMTDIFFASIDQRDEKAAGGNACTVLAAVIADWLHKNPKNLPQRRQFDNLVHEGSSEWRKLCAVTARNNEFSDQHFDLETVMKARIRDLSVTTDMSYIGFFSSEGMIERFGFLEGAMSFDNVWNELLSADNAGEGRVYITGWNDHFFVLKVEKDAIYLIDTLGERLFEGCKQAYILKFHEGSMICKRETEDGCQTEKIEKCSEEHEKDYYHCKGMGCCREYIKEFLAGLPLRELLEDDLQRGLVEKALHQRLQIEFHYTVPL